MKQFASADVKAFMNALLMADTFHDWNFREAKLGLETFIEIDGTYNADYFTENAPEGFILWSDIQGKICNLIKGGKTPSYIRMTLSAPASWVKGEYISAYLLNMEFSKGALIFTSAVSTKSFTMDKSPEKYWDELVLKFFEKKSLAVSALD